MAKQVINVGSSAGDGSGDALRDAMIKINANFTELYNGIVVQTIVGEDDTVLVNINDSSINANALSGTVPTGVATWANLGGKPTSVAGFGIADAYTIAQTDAQIASEIDDLKISLAADGGDLKGSVFADDSTLLVDGVNGKLVGDIKNSLIETDNITALPGASDLFIQGGADSGTPGNRARVNIGTTNTSTIILGAGDTDIYFNGTPGSSVVAGRLIGDLTGSVFGSDSTLLVDGVNGRIVGDYENGTSTIGSTRVESYDIKAFQDTNTNDLYVANTIWGGETGTLKNVSIGSLPPSTSNGASGDRSGMIALDSSYIYYCTANYTDGVADIWKRVAWSGDTW